MTMTGAGPVLSVQLVPRGGRDAVEAIVLDAAGRSWLRVRVRAVPEKGRANEALLALLADWLELPRSAITLASGAGSRHKQLRIAAPERQVTARLEALRA
ncbi:MAG: DUF167 domain-containing protein, partial [Alphaproteobacteria bacterium]|nr:DUF167 domain-containing protein [Alphaproteobacteria bacterium]